MAPNYREEEIAQNLNNIFAEDNKNVTISNIKSPTGDFTREIIIAALKESGFNLGKITKVTEYRAVVRFSNLGGADSSRLSIALPVLFFETPNSGMKKNPF